MEKVLLVNPPDSGQSFRWGQKRTVYPPLGLCYIAGMLDTKYEVKVLDAFALDMTADDVLGRIKRENPTTIGLSCNSSTMLNAVKHISKKIKAYDKNIKVIAGGYLQTHRDEFLRDSVDYIVKGEAELTFLELTEAIDKQQDIKKVQGICFASEDGGIFETPDRPLIKDIDTLPIAARHLLEPSVASERYKTPQMFKRLPTTMCISSRGCPYTCTFCSKIFGTDYRTHSPEYVIREMKYLQENFGIKDIKYFDDNFLVDTDRVKKICELIIKEGVDMTWSCLGTIATIHNHPDLLEKMKAAGCWYISFGVETGNAKVMRDIRKPTTIDQVKKVILLAEKSGILTRGYFMLGHPTDTKETINDTINFAKSLPFDSVQFNFAVPYPGTEFYEQAKNTGEFDENYDYMSGHAARPIYVPDGLTPEELIKLQKQAYRKFYFRPKYIASRLGKITSFSDFKRYAKNALAYIKHN